MHADANRRREGGAEGQHFALTYCQTAPLVCPKYVHWACQELIEGGEGGTEVSLSRLHIN